MSRKLFLIKASKPAVKSELNYVSLVDCLMVLVTYLLTVTATLGSQKFLDVGTKATTASASTAASNEALAVLSLHADHSASLLIRRDGNNAQTQALAALAGNWDYASARKALIAWPPVARVLLSADDDVVYADIVAASIALRAVAPVSLAFKQ